MVGKEGACAKVRLGSQRSVGAVRARRDKRVRMLGSQGWPGKYGGEGNGEVRMEVGEMAEQWMVRDRNP